MIPLPPGCSVNYAITIDLSELITEMVEWYKMIGGIITEKQYWTRNKEITVQYVQYGKSKPCHRRQDGTTGVRLHFHGNDASVASMFIIKFLDYVEQTNLNTHMETV